MSIETSRKTVALTGEELATVEAARTQGSSAYNALVELIGPAATRSETATIQALVQLGVNVVKEKAMTSGYAALAAMQNDEDRAYHATARRRRSNNED
jgi:hypothetical protein